MKLGYKLQTKTIEFYYIKQDLHNLLLIVEKNYGELSILCHN